MQNKHLWAAVSIAVIWIATAVIGVFGKALHIASPHQLEIPVLAIIVGTFALISTILIAIFGFRSST
jgi:hypothetical protein